MSKTHGSPPKSDTSFGLRVDSDSVKGLTVMHTDKLLMVAYVYRC